MNKKNILIFGLSIILFISIFNLNSYCEENKKVISLSGAWALYPMAVRWAEEYKKINPDIKIDISAGGAGKGISDALSNIVDIGMVSRDINEEEIKKGALAIAVTKDAVVATVNAKNPFIKEILSKGMKRENFKDIFLTTKIQNWNDIYKTPKLKKTPKINVFTRSDACGAAETWAKYFGAKQENLKGIGIFGDPGIAGAVIKDVLSIGYNNIGFAFDNKTKKMIKGLKVVPIDINENGKIDAEENFYDDISKIVNAIAKGVYPSPPARNLFFVSNGKPKSQIVKDFIKWVLSDGQKFVFEAGYINLNKDTLNKQIELIK